MEEEENVKTEKKPPIELRIVDHQQITDLQCGICLSLLQNPKQCKNGHLYCSACILRSIQKKPQCPTCRCDLTEKELSRSLFVEKILRGLGIWCRFHFHFDIISGEWGVDPGGCGETGEIEFISKHEFQCGYIFCECVYSPTCPLIRKKDLSAHKEVCEWRPVGCPFCHISVQACKVEDHLVVCPGTPLVCELCKEQVKRSEMELHVLKVCPEYVSLCPYGCKERVARKNVKMHLQENMVEHFESLRLSIQNIEANYINELRRRDKEIQILKKKVKNETKVIWVIECWKRTKKLGYVPSKKFDLGGCNWFFGLYPDGDIEESRGHLSIYLFLEKAPPKGKTLAVDFRITLVNQKNIKETIRKELKTTFPLKENQPGWGDRRVVKASLISEESGFLFNDKLHIEADINIKQVSYCV